MQAIVPSDLKPMELGELLDASLTLFRRHFGLFVQLGVVALWLPVALTIYLQLTGGPQQHLVMAGGVWVLQYFGGLFLTASAIRVISDSYLGRTPQLGDALALGASKIWSLFLVGLGKSILLGAIAMLGGGAAAAIIGLGGGNAVAVLVVIALVAGCLWFLGYVACGYAVTTPTVVLEHLPGSFDAFGRSWELTRGFKRKIFGIFAVTFLMVYVPAGVISGIGQALAIQMPAVGGVVAIISGVIPIVLTPLLSCVLTLVYYDLRVRREAFDLQILSQQLELR